ncbi:MAG: hypothetical protein ACLQVI_32065 [Polyangiaceae bacterium]
MIPLIKFVMCAMMPRTESLPGIADTDVDGFLRRLRKDAIPLYWVGLVLGAVVFVLTPPFTIGVPLPAFALSKKLLDRHTERILAHPIYVIRQAVFLVRVSGGLCWGADERVRAHFALAPYPPDPGTFRQS